MYRNHSYFAVLGRQEAFLFLISILISLLTVLLQGFFLLWYIHREVKVVSFCKLVNIYSGNYSLATLFLHELQSWTAIIEPSEDKMQHCPDVINCTFLVRITVVMDMPLHPSHYLIICHLQHMQIYILSIPSFLISRWSHANIHVI